MIKPGDRRVIELDLDSFTECTCKRAWYVDVDRGDKAYTFRTDLSEKYVHQALVPIEATEKFDNAACHNQTNLTDEDFRIWKVIE